MMDTMVDQINIVASHLLPALPGSSDLLSNTRTSVEISISGNNNNVSDKEVMTTLQRDAGARAPETVYLQSVLLSNSSLSLKPRLGVEFVFPPSQ